MSTIAVFLPSFHVHTLHSRSSRTFMRLLPPPTDFSLSLFGSPIRMWTNFHSFPPSPPPSLLPPLPLSLSHSIAGFLHSRPPSSLLHFTPPPSLESHLLTPRSRTSSPQLFNLFTSTLQPPHLNSSHFLFTSTPLHHTSSPQLFTSTLHQHTSSPHLFIILPLNPPSLPPFLVSPRITLSTLELGLLNLVDVAILIVHACFFTLKCILILSHWPW